MHSSAQIIRSAGRGSARTACPAVIRRSPDSNLSLSTFEPVSVLEPEIRREKVRRGQRLGRHFWRHSPIPGSGDRPVPRLRRQSRGQLKTIPTALGNRNCAGLRGGRPRTRTLDPLIKSQRRAGHGGHALDFVFSGRRSLRRAGDDCTEVHRAVGQPVVIEFRSRPTRRWAPGSLPRTRCCCEGRRRRRYSGDGRANTSRTLPGHSCGYLNLSH
jgi:hypothetical protein